MAQTKIREDQCKDGTMLRWVASATEEPTASDLTNLPNPSAALVKGTTDRVFIGWKDDEGSHFVELTKP